MLVYEIQKAINDRFSQILVTNFIHLQLSKFIKLM